MFLFPKIKMGNLPQIYGSGPKQREIAINCNSTSVARVLPQCLHNVKQKYFIVLIQRTNKAVL